MKAAGIILLSTALAVTLCGCIGSGFSEARRGRALQQGVLPYESGSTGFGSNTVRQAGSTFTNGFNNYDQTQQSPSTASSSGQPNR